MRKIVFSMFFMFAMFVLLGSASVHAQAQYRAHIPFDFNTGDKVYKAGDYTVGPSSGSTNYSVIMLKNSEDGEAAFLRGASMAPDPQTRKGKLIFAVTDGGYVLTNIETPNWNMKMKRTVTRVKLVKGKAPKASTVSVLLH